MAQLLRDEFLSQLRAAETVESATLVVEEKRLTQLLWKIGRMRAMHQRLGSQ